MYIGLFLTRDAFDFLTRYTRWRKWCSIFLFRTAGFINHVMYFLKEKICFYGYSSCLILFIFIFFVCVVLCWHVNKLA